jgi:hypothetical protein
VLTAEAFRPAAGLMHLRYTLEGPLDQVRLPPPGPTERTDELWRHTCFEAFVQSADGYHELNFAPSCRWAAYRFTSYRSGIAPADLPLPHMQVSQAPDRFELAALLDLSRAGLPSGPWSAGLTAVVEAADGGVSYRALAHPPGKPDFNHPDSFVLSLPAPA